MTAQRLIVEVEGCPVEAVQSELSLLAVSPDAALRAAPGDGVKLVLSARNCPQDSHEALKSSAVRDFVRRHFPH